MGDEKSGKFAVFHEIPSRGLPADHGHADQDGMQEQHRHIGQRSDSERDAIGAREGRYPARAPRSPRFLTAMRSKTAHARNDPNSSMPPASPLARRCASAQISIATSIG